MSVEVRRELIKQILKRGVDLAKKDPVVQQQLKEMGEENTSMLFLIEDLKTPFGFQVKEGRMEFIETPNLNQKYDLITTTNANTFVHILKGLDPEECFWRGLIEVSGKGWFKRICLLRRIFQIGETQGLKTKVVGQ